MPVIKRARTPFIVVMEEEARPEAKMEAKMTGAAMLGVWRLILCNGYRKRLGPDDPHIQKPRKGKATAPQ